MAVKIVDLSQPFGVDTPLWPFPGPRQDLIFARGEYHERFHKRSVVYTGTLHAGTHLDAPSHVLYTREGGYMLDKVPLDNCYGTGVIIDFRHLADVDKNKWHHITVKELENANPKIQKGDFVVVNTGWHKQWRWDNFAYYNYYPGLGPEAGKWLVDKGVKRGFRYLGRYGWPAMALPIVPDYALAAPGEYKQVTGKDADVEFPEYEPVHRMFARAQITAVENAGGDIDQVTGKRVTVACFPFRCEMADGGFVRLVAIIDEK